MSCFQYITHFTPIFCNSALYSYPFLQEAWRGNYIYCEHSRFVIILVSWLTAAECSPVEDISRNRYYCKTYTENQKISYINMLTVAFDTYDRKQNSVTSVFKMRRVRNWKYRIYIFYSHAAYYLLEWRTDDCVLNLLSSALTLSVFVKKPMLSFVSHMGATHVAFWVARAVNLRRILRCDTA